MQSPVSKKHVYAGVLVLLFFLAGLFILFSDALGRYPELNRIQDQNLTFNEYADFFEGLAEERGGAYAFQALLHADIAPGTDIHLLGHVVGDILYKQEGIDGIHTCTPDFRNACSHAIVVGLFTDRGVEALDEIAAACSAAPGGTGAYTMCFHGLGHGILAYANYDFAQAVSMCSNVGTAERNYREYDECVGGATMEMIAGVHDRRAWEIERAQYFDDEDPLAPCNTAAVPDAVKPICYTYLTPHLFEAAGGDLAALSPNVYERAFNYCNTIPLKQREARDACYGGFGKEFVVQVQDRDVRDVGSTDEDALRQVRTWCALAGDPIGELVCNGNALASLFWGGENNPDASFAFCAVATDGRLRQECYAQLAQTITYYADDRYRARALCNRLPEPHQQFCLERL